MFFNRAQQEQLYKSTAGNSLKSKTQTVPHWRDVVHFVCSNLHCDRLDELSLMISAPGTMRQVMGSCVPSGNNAQMIRLRQMAAFFTLQPPGQMQGIVARHALQVGAQGTLASTLSTACSKCDRDGSMRTHTPFAEIQV